MPKKSITATASAVERKSPPKASGRVQNSNPYDNLAAIWTVLRDYATPEKPLSASEVFRYLKSAGQPHPSVDTVSTLLEERQEAMGLLFGRAVVPSQQTVQKMLRNQCESARKDTAPLTLTCTAKTGKISVPFADYDLVCDDIAQKKEAEQEGNDSKNAGLPREAMPTRYYHLASPLTQGEWRIFGDLVTFSPFISQEQTRKFRQVLHGLSGLPLTTTPTDYAFKREHTNLFKIIHTLHNALALHQKIRVFYGTYVLQSTADHTLTPQLVKRDKNSDLALTPKSLLWANGLYYLVAQHEKYGTMHLRVDRILSVTATGETFTPDATFSPERLRDHAPAMYGGTLEQIVFTCPSSFLNTVLDFFGSAPQYTLAGDTITCSVRATLPGAKLFALQYLDSVTVLSPPALREALAQALRKGQAKYQSPTQGKT